MSFARPALNYDWTALTLRLSAMVLTIAMVSYFAMATGLGISWIPTKVAGHNPENLHLFRQVYYARESLA